MRSRARKSMISGANTRTATLESKFVHDVDKIELVLQMVGYECVHERKLDLGYLGWVASRIELES